MSPTNISHSGSAMFQSQLWGATSRDWVDYQEPLMAPWYESVLDSAGIAESVKLLDVGCGAGLFIHMAAGRGAVVSGLDATPEFITICQQRTPQADLHTGDMEALPFENNRFEVVTGLNSFQFAGNPLHALQEARRVTRPGGLLVFGVFGPPEDCDMAAPLEAFTRLMPPLPPGVKGPFALSEDGAVESLVRQAGWEPLENVTTHLPYDFEDEASALRCLLSNGPAMIAFRASGPERVRQAVLESIQAYKTADGGYHLDNQFRHLIARRRESSL